MVQASQPSVPVAETIKVFIHKTFHMKRLCVLTKTKNSQNYLDLVSGLWKRLSKRNWHTIGITSTLFRLLTERDQ